MSSSDVREFEELRARVAALADRVSELEAGQARLTAAYGEQGARLLDLAALLPKDVSGELYGAQPDHAADREARAGLVRRPPRGA